MCQCLTQFKTYLLKTLESSKYFEKRTKFYMFKFMHIYMTSVLVHKFVKANPLEKIL